MFGKGRGRGRGGERGKKEEKIKALSSLERRDFSAHEVESIIPAIAPDYY